MKHKIIISLVLSAVIILAGAVSCGQGDIQEQYDILLEQYNEANEQIGELQSKLYDAQALQDAYDELSEVYDELLEDNSANIDEIALLGAQITALDDEIEALNAEIEDLINELADLTFEYDTLKAQYDTLVGLAAEVNEANIEQALFELINQERLSHGLNALTTGHNLYDWALINCQNMAVSKELEVYTGQAVPFQRAFIAAGYSSLDRLVNAAMIIWQSHALSYQENVLDEEAIYGAVRVLKSGEIYYITFMASNYP